MRPEEAHGERQHAQRERRPRQPARERQSARMSAREGAEEGGGAERRPCPDEAMPPDAPQATEEGAQGAEHPPTAHHAHRRRTDATQSAERGEGRSYPPAAPRRSTAARNDQQGARVTPI